MPYDWQDADQGTLMDFGSLGPGEATEELPTYKIQEVSFGVALTDLNGEAALNLEGKIGDNWFTLPGMNILIASADPANVFSSILRYDHCGSIQGIRCRFVTASEADPANPHNPVAAVKAKAVRIPD